MKDMVESTVVKENHSREVGMPLPREAQSLNIIRDTYQNVGEVEYVKALYELRKEQKEMIKRLADFNGVTQVSIVRDIIDEWRQMKLRENGQK